MSSTLLYNTKTLRKEEFRPLEPGHARARAARGRAFRPLHARALVLAAHVFELDLTKDDEDAVPGVVDTTSNFFLDK